MGGLLRRGTRPGAGPGRGEGRASHRVAAPAERVVLLAARADERRRLALAIGRCGHAVAAVASSAEALAELEAADAAALVVSVRQDGGRGLDLVRRAREASPDLQVLLAAGRISACGALAALRAGVTDVVVGAADHPAGLAAVLGRAVEAHRRAREVRLEALATRAARDHLEALLHRLPLGLLVVDRGGRVLFANEPARELLAAGDGLSLGPSGELAAASPRLARSLAGLVAAACDGSAGPARGGALSVRRPEAGTALSLRVEALPGDPGTVAGAVAAVLIGDATHRPEVEPAALRDVYGLTTAEAAMAAALIRAGSVDDAARSLGISVQTARTHLKHAFSKTETARQGDLVGLVLSGPAIFRAGPC